MRRWLSSALFALTLAGCPARPSNPDATADVILAPIDTGADAQPEAATDVAVLDAADAIASDARADDALSDADGAIAEGGRPDGAPRCDPDAGLGDGGCVLCPTTSAAFLDRCTGATCARFENSRCGRLLPDGGLPPLP